MDNESPNPKRLASLFSLACEASALWSKNELGAILTHQLDAPLVVDLDRLDDYVALDRDVAPPISSFRDLFFHPHPPIVLLRLVKEYAKVHRTASESPLPPEVATVLYYASIVVARAIRGQSISSLDDKRMLEGVQWAVQQAWVSDDLKTFLQGLQRQFTGGAAGS